MLIASELLPVEGSKHNRCENCSQEKDHQGERTRQQKEDRGKQQRDNHVGYGTVAMICAGSGNPSRRGLTTTVEPPTRRHGTGSKHPVTVGVHLKTIGTDRRVQGAENTCMYIDRHK